MNKPCLISALMLASSRVASAQVTPPDFIDSLAQQWSGGRSTASCAVDGKDINDKQVFRCTWKVPAAQQVLGEVFTNRYPSEPPMLEWQRPTLNTADAHRLSDSLDTSLKLRGLTLRGCGPASQTPAGLSISRVWESDRLTVLITTITPSAGNPKLLVTAIPARDLLPDVVCPKSSRL